jgi:hypothetical protein
MEVEEGEGEMLSEVHVLWLYLPWLYLLWRGRDAERGRLLRRARLTHSPSHPLHTPFSSPSQPLLTAIPHPYYHPSPNTHTHTPRQVYFAKFLTSAKLINLQLRDVYFRRHVLVQILMFLQTAAAQDKLLVTLALALALALALNTLAFTLTLTAHRSPSP